MEAMGYGTPVIITDTGGGKEVVEDGVSGFVVPVEDPAAISRRVEQLHKDPDLCRQLAENGRRNLEDRFSSARTTDKYLAFFGALAGASGLPDPG